MRWHAISGSWRYTNSDIQTDTKRVVKAIISSNEGIITGGALRVDYYATDLMMNEGNPKGHLKIYLPTSLDSLLNHYRKRQFEGVINKMQALSVISQLADVKRMYPECLIEGDYEFPNEESYYARNTKIIQDCNVFHAFWVNKSGGVRDAINKALDLGKEVHVYQYAIKK